MQYKFKDRSIQKGDYAWAKFAHSYHQSQWQVIQKGELSLKVSLHVFAAKGKMAG